MIISITIITFGLLTNGLAIPTPSKKDDKTPFTLEEALYLYGTRSFASSWISDNQFQFKDTATGNYIVYDANTGNYETFFEYSRLSNITGISQVQFSPDRKYALVSYGCVQLFRYSRDCKYVIYSIENDWIVDLANKAFLQLADWAPQGNGLAYVKDNNMHYVSYFDRTQVTDTQLSDTGVLGVVYNGISDWVYEEEILATSKAFYFSPTGDVLLFIQFNDTNVPEFEYQFYGTPGLKSQYPEIERLRYPKVGAPNPEFSEISYYISSGKKAGPTSFPVAKDPRSDIFLGYRFVNDDLVVAGAANRVQNNTWFNLCHLKDATCYTLYEEQNDKGWADLELPLVSREADRFLKIVAQPYELNRSFPHLTLFPTGEDCSPNCGKPLALTQGQYAVTRIIGWDQDNRIVYFSASEENEPARRQVYSVAENGTSIYCLSCQIVSPEGNRCKSADASFSSKFSYVILTCTGPDPLVSYLYKNTLPLGDPLLILEDNKDLRDRLARKLLPEKLDLRVSVPGSFQAEVRLLLPPNYDPSGNTTYPLIDYVYAGPDSKQISDDFSVGWNAYLTTNLNIIIALIDARGSARKEREMLYSNYRALGTAEMEDQISVTAYLQKQFPFIDSKRTGIWGWSYGGYTTVKTLELDISNVFQCGISVAPVTSWLYYDSMYTERYMGLPTEEDNLKGYQRSDAYNVTNLKNKQYYLIHGTGDDNVHYQQSLLLSRMLELNDVLFQQQSYTDENHSLGSVTQHLYHSMAAFWRRCFNLPNEKRKLRPK